MTTVGMKLIMMLILRMLVMVMLISLLVVVMMVKIMVVIVMMMISEAAAADNDGKEYDYIHDGGVGYILADRDGIDNGDVESDDHNVDGSGNYDDNSDVENEAWYPVDIIPCLLRARLWILKF